MLNQVNESVPMSPNNGKSAESLKHAHMSWYVIIAAQRIVKMRSRIQVRWTIGLIDELEDHRLVCRFPQFCIRLALLSRMDLFSVNIGVPLSRFG